VRDIWSAILLVYVITVYQSVEAMVSVIGSDTAVQRFATQQSVTANARIAGFAALDGGFLLTTATATATFDSYFPVSGSVNLSGGRLLLNKDLYLENVASFVGTGTTFGANNKLIFSSVYTLTGSTSVCTTFSDVNMVLGGNFTLQGVCLKFAGHSVVTGNGNIITINPSSQIVVDNNASVLFENVVLRNVHTGQFLCLDNLGTISFQNTQLVMDADYTFSNGKFNILNQLLISGPGFSFIYTSTQASVIASNAVLMLDDSTTFSYQPSTGLRTALTFTDTTSALYLSGATFAAATSGIALIKGRLLADGSSALSSRGTNSGNGITFGDGTTVSNDFFIRILPAANLFFNNGFFFYNNL
jgi:hypothetical protein